MAHLPGATRLKETEELVAACLRDHLTPLASATLLAHPLLFLDLEAAAIAAGRSIASEFGAVVVEPGRGAGGPELHIEAWHGYLAVPLPEPVWTHSLSPRFLTLDAESSNNDARLKRDAARGEPSALRTAYRAARTARGELRAIEVCGALCAWLRRAAGRIVCKGPRDRLWLLELLLLSSGAGDLARELGAAMVDADPFCGRFLSAVAGTGRGLRAWMEATCRACVSALPTHHPTADAAALCLVAAETASRALSCLGDAGKQQQQHPQSGRPAPGSAAALLLGAEPDSPYQCWFAANDQWSRWMGSRAAAWMRSAGLARCDLLVAHLGAYLRACGRANGSLLAPPGRHSQDSAVRCMQQLVSTVEACLVQTLCQAGTRFYALGPDARLAVVCGILRAFRHTSAPPQT